MATATAPTPVGAPPAPCTECGNPVLGRYTTGQRSVVLDAEPVAGGLYRLDGQNRAARRLLTELFAERHAPQPGYQPHQCAPPRNWYDRD